MRSPIDLGPFRVDEQIGRGGMGSVYAGEHADGARVAVKVIAAALAGNPRFRASFRDEVRAVASLDHPGIVMVFDQGVVGADAAARSFGAFAEGAPYFVMELVPHGTLEGVGRAGGLDVPSWPWLRKALIDLLDALAHAHARGVVHRDIKPGNVMLASAGEHPAIKLTDFGIAHRLDEAATTIQRAVSGTPHYMAPEQAEGRIYELGPWTDLYAVGCLAYRLAGGRPPFWEPEISVGETLRRHVMAPIPTLRSRVPVPDGFGAWLEGMLAKRPAARFRCAADAAAALVDLGDATPTRGCPPATTPDDEATDDLPTRAAAYAVALHGTVVWESTPVPRVAHEPAARDPSRRLPALPATWRATETPRRSHALAGAGLGLFALRPAPLVGREHERDALWNAMIAVHVSRAPRVVVLRGAGGVGKTRLADWLATRVREVGAATVLSAFHAATAGGAEGVGPMLARALRVAGLSRREASDAITAEVLALGGSESESTALLELTHPHADDDDPDPGAPRVCFATPRERHHVLARYVELLTRQRPVLLRIEDAQWGLDALSFAQHLLASARPVLCLLVVSDDALRERLAEAAALAALTARAAAVTIELRPLDADRHDELCAGLLGLESELAGEVARRTSGNPLFAVQLVGDWVQRGILEVGEHGFGLRAGADALVPDDIHALWLRRVERAIGTSGAIASVERAALLGRSVDAVEWERATADMRLPPPAEVAPVLELYGLVRRDGPAWAFCHGMLVESLARHAREAGRWEEHHRACAASLRGGPRARAAGMAERVAGHLEAAGDLEAALEPAFVAAWERYEESSFAAALALLDRRDAWIARLALPDADPRRGWGLLRRAMVLMRMARVNEATPLIARVEVAARAHGPGELVAEALYARAKNAQMAGTAAESIARYAEARARFRAAADRRGAARCEHGIAEMQRQSWRLDEARAGYESALEGYAASGDRLGCASCLLGLADLAMRDQRGDAVAMIAQAEQELTAMGNRLGLAVARLQRGFAQRTLGRLDEAEALFWQSAAMLDAVGSEDVVVPKGNVGMLCLLRGDYVRAEALFEEVHRSYHALGRDGYLCFTHLQLLACRAAHGDWASFDEHCAAAEAALARTGLTDDDLELPARLAVDLARRAGEVARAERADAIARAQRAALSRGAGGSRDG